MKPTGCPSTWKCGTSHYFLPISYYFFQLWVQNLTFFAFWGLASQTSQNYTKEYCKLNLFQAATSIKQPRSPFGLYPDESVPIVDRKSCLLVF